MRISLFVFCSSVAISIFTACSGTDGGGVDDETTEQATGELSTCAKRKCGPALGTPTVKCEDGSIGGSTGRCLAHKNGSCGWEVRVCPEPKPTDCSAPGACGPALGMPNYLCADGKTVAGPGACVDQGGACGWDIVSCPAN